MTLDKTFDSFSEAHWIDRACDRFEIAWQEGKPLKIESFLDNCPVQIRPALVNELVSLEMELRRGQGELPSVEEYAVRFPGIDLNAIETEQILERNLGSQTANETTLDSPGIAGSRKHDDLKGAKIRYLGDYELLERIARGGMGIVYKARQQTLGRIVAVKMILAGQFAEKQDIDRFRSEATAAAKLDHPGIVPIYEVGEQDGRHFYSMCFVEGGSLAQRLQVGPLPPHESADLLTKIADAVHYAHLKGVIHRDIKPANILIDANGEPRVTDFGLAKLVMGSSDITRSGQILGTPSYMPPEQAAAQASEIGPASDVYSLGALLYSLLTGRPPFQAATPIETLLQVQKQEPVSPRQFNANIPIDLETIALKCLDKSPSRRYASADDLAQELRRYLSGKPILARPLSRTEQAWRWCRRNPAVASLATLILLLISGITVGSAWAYFRESGLRKNLKVALDHQTELTESERQAKLKETVARKAADDAKAIADNATLRATSAATAADAASLNADRTAALAEARYFIQVRDMPEALRRIQKADKLGLRYKDRLLLDEFYIASRGQWRLIDSFPAKPEGACYLSHNGKSRLAFYLGTQLRVRGASEGDDETIELKERPVEILESGASRFLIRTENSVQMFTLQDGLHEIANRSFEGIIHSVKTSAESVLISVSSGVFDSGTLRLLHAHNLEEKQTWDWDKLPGSLPPKSRCYLSPKDHYILLQNGAWNEPVVLIDRKQNKDAQLIQEGVIRLGPNGQLAFSPQSDDQCYTWFAPSGDGGYNDQLGLYNLTDPVDPNWRFVKSTETKVPKRLIVSGARTTLLGEVGMVSLQQVLDQAPEMVRYRTLWPFEDDQATFLAVDKEAVTLSLSTKQGVVTYVRSKDRTLQGTENWASTPIATGVLALRNVRLDFTPYSPSEKRWSIKPQWLSNTPNRAWNVWGIDVSENNQFAAILAQESDGDDTVTNQYFRKQVLIYDISSGIENPDSWKIVRQIELSEFAGRHGFDNLSVRLTSDGKAFTYVAKRQLGRYDCSSGKCLGTHRYLNWAATSADGSLFSVDDDESNSITVCRVSDGEQVCSIEAGRTLEGCFSDNNQYLLVSSGAEMKCFDVKSGKLNWEKDSDLIPRAWPENGPHFIALSKEESARGGSLVLVDQATLEPEAILSRTGSRQNQAVFSPDQQAIYCDNHRGECKIIHTFDLPNLLQALRTPEGGFLASKSPLPPVASPAPPTGKPQSAKDTKSLKSAIGQEVSVEGIVKNVSFTAARNALNIEFDDGSNDPLLIWVPPPVFKDFMKQPNDFDPHALVGKNIRAKGRLTSYAGKIGSWKNRLQITLGSIDSLETIENVDK